MVTSYQGSKLQADVGNVQTKDKYIGSKLQQDVQKQSIASPAQIAKTTPVNRQGGHGYVSTEPSPVYNQGKLLGFNTDKGFVPKESAVTKSGSYDPSQVRIQREVMADKGATRVQYFDTPGGKLQVIDKGDKVQYRTSEGVYKSERTYGSTISQEEQGNKLDRALGIGTYDISKQTYTDAFGNKKSMKFSGVPKGTKIVASQNSYLFEKQIGTYTDPNTGRAVPVTEVYYRSEEGTRLATPEERNYYRSQPGQLKAVSYSKEEYEKKKNIIAAKSAIAEFEEGTIQQLGGIIRQGRYETGQNLKDYRKQIQKKTGITGSSFGRAVTEAAFPLLGASRFLDEKGIIKEPGVAGSVRQFGTGFIKGAYKDIEADPLGEVVTYGTGALVGAGVPAAIRGARAVPIVGNILGTSVKATSVLAGVGLTAAYAGDVGIKSYKAIKEKNYEKAGGVAGVAIKDLAVFGSGIAKGQKVYQKTAGLITTRGRTSVDIQQGDYPKAPPNEQLNLFERNVIKELGPEPVSFHTTPQKFWNKGIIEPKEGTSELPGLYASTQISRQFAKIPGSGSTGEFKLFGSLELKEPAVAAIKPRGFRYSEIGFSESKVFEGQKFVKNRGYAYFKNPSKAGYGDIPKGFKSEIETVYRVDAGNFAIESEKFYTNIFDVRVPLDVFKYDSGIKKTAPTLETKSKAQGYYSPQRILIPAETSYVSFKYKGNAPISSSSKIIRPSYVYSEPVSSIGTSSISRISKPSRASSSMKSISSSISRSVSRLSSNIASYSKLSSGSVSKNTYKRYPAYSKSNLNEPKIYYPVKIKKLRYDLPLYSKPKKNDKKLNSSSFDLLLIKKGKPTKIASNLLREDALDLGTRKTLGNLDATFLLRKGAGPARDIITEKEFSRYSRLFRKPTAKSKYRMLGEEVFIQKQSKVPSLGRGRLTTRGERAAIQASRGKYVNYIR